MNDDQFDDLKQFIETTVSQSEKRLKTELASKEEIQTGFDKLGQKIDDGFAGVGEAIDRLSVPLTTGFSRWQKGSLERTQGLVSA